MQYVRSFLGVIGVFLLATLAFAAEPAVEKKYVATVDPDGVQRVEMMGGAYYFIPNLIVVKVNVPVELKVRKEGSITPHDIVLKAPEAGIDFSQELRSEPALIRFTPTRIGRYEFECSKRFLNFESHKERGMHGVLQVVE